ncbi:MAG: HesA/MoeB/ThiF family protein [Thermoplasmatales archaeon]|nr:MAG: HesA/MoeB/ThiF family protein [Thermoplasmatales archaeon]
MNLNRYRRQIIVKRLGEKGQYILSEKHIIILGCGGLGSNSANILVRTGIGSIDIVDDDLLDLTNLHRTSLFNEEDTSKLKCQILEEKLQQINSEVTVKGIKKRITKENIESVVKRADIIIDGTDNMETRFLINEVAVKSNIPWIYAGVHGTVGMVMGIIPRQTPCLKCISQSIVDNIEGEIPVLGNLPVIIASIQCTEAMKTLLGKQLSGMIIYDIWKQRFEQIDLKRNPDCMCCSKEQFEFL